LQGEEMTIGAIPRAALRWRAGLDAGELGRRKGAIIEPWSRTGWFAGSDDVLSTLRFMWSSRTIRGAEPMDVLAAAGFDRDQ